MIVMQNARTAAATLRKEIPSITRVLVARTDGLTFFDEGPRAEHDRSASITSVMFSIAERAAESFALGGVNVTTTIGPDGSFSVYPIDERHVLGVAADPTANLVLLARVAGRVSARLAGLEAASTLPTRVKGPAAP